MMKDTAYLGSILLRSSLISSALVIIFSIPTETYATEWNYREQSKIQWRDYGDAVFDEAKEKDKPLYVLIYADWCHWCKKFEVETLETEQIRRIFKERVIPVAVDKDMQPEIGQKIGSRLVPTSVILTPDGIQLLRFHGYLSASDLDTTLRSVLLRWRRGEFPEEIFGDQSTCCPVR